VSDRTPPPFDAIVDPDDPDRDRLEQAHRLLVAAGPLPELPPRLEDAPPEPTARVLAFPRHRYTAIAAVAIAATLLFGIGYAIGGRDNPPEPVQTVAMVGPSGAQGSIALMAIDRAGNWPMTIEIKGLAQLPKGKTYALWLTKHGKLADPCGTFVVGPGTTEVPLNAPYKLKEYSGWVVVLSGTKGPFVLRTTTV
jgi:Anti-sigma-K factor rskA